MSQGDTRIVLGSLLALVALATPSLGEAPTALQDGRRARPRSARAARARGDGQWDVGVLRAPALAAGLVVALLLVAVPVARPGSRAARDHRDDRRRRGAARAGASRCRRACATRRRPGSTTTTRPTRSRSPATSCATGRTPTATTTAAPACSASTRTTAAPSPAAETNPALRHFPYLPGTAELATVWRLLPSPLDDVRFLVCLASLAMLAAALGVSRAALARGSCSAPCSRRTR